MKKLLFIFLFISLPLFSQTPGSIDPTFNSTDAGYDVISGIGYNWYLSGSASNGQVFCSSIQSDGKIIIGGNFIVYNGITTNKIARLNTDGSLDTTFNIGAGFISTQSTGVNALCIQPDGKILVGGTFTNYNGVDVNGLVRLYADGSLDTTFNAGNGPNNSIKSIVTQPDGKIFVCGNFTLFNNVVANYIVKLNGNGTVDNSFDSANSQPNTAGINCMAIQPDGKVIIGGNFTTYFGVTTNRIAKLNPNGTLDQNFNSGAGFNGSVNSITCYPDGEILVGGNFTTYDGGTNKYIIRLLNNGLKDTTFNTVNIGLNSSVTQVKLVSNAINSKILIIGNFTDYNGFGRNKIARLTQYGTLDNTFNIEPVIIPTLYDPNYTVITTFHSISIQNDGKIILCGQFQTTYYNGASVNRLDTSGYFDFTFNTKKLTGANGTIRAMQTQTNGKILLAGDFTEYNGYHSPGIVRINPNGDVDYSFQSPFYYVNTNNFTSIKDIAIQSNGQIIVAGRLFDTDLAVPTFIKRLDPNGFIDVTFTPPTSANNIIYAVDIQSDGKIIFGGWCTPKLSRLNTDGTIDTLFNIGTGPNNYVYEIKQQTDGKILIGGAFTSYNGINSSNIARININGVFDTSFTGTGSGKINTIVPQTDGKYIIAGNFATYNSVATRCLARINSNGTIDQSFSPISTNSGNGIIVISAISVQSDGKIIIGGEFTNINGISRNNIARLNSDGSLDSTFQIGGANDVVNASIVQSDGKILIGGNFNAYNSTGRNRAARLNGGNALAVSEIIGLNKIIFFPNPAHESITIKLGDNLISNCSLRVNNLLGQEVYRCILQGSETQIAKTWSGTGLYLVNIYDQNNQLLETHKVVFE
ncbi:MAG: hypothetical protein RL699_1411 [Bacteroidota bacterium]|jgi:uncharacterized delta-60 repeat protein